MSPRKSRSNEARIAAFPALAALALAGCAKEAAPISLSEAAPAQRDWVTACEGSDDWDKPAPPFLIHGNTYYVGTCGITALLVAGPQGHTLIDTGTDKGADVVLANIRSLGFFPRDVKTLLMTHEHFDHVGGMAKVQAATGATVVASAAAAQVLRSGRPGKEDPQFASGHPPFPPVTGRIVTLGRATVQRYSGREFQPIFTPGHTPGATSWRWRECDGGKDCRTIVYIDSLNPISADGFRFSARPQLVAAMRGAVKAVAASPCDIALAPHPSAVQLRERLVGTRPLVDRSGCKAFAATVTQRLDARLAKENAGG